MKKNYKVETKGSLWEVELISGHYDGWDVEYHIFSGNSEEEVWEFIKIWASQGGIQNNWNNWIYGLVWNNRKFQFREKEEMDWQTVCGDALKVEIHRANVIYVNPDKLLKDTN